MRLATTVAVVAAAIAAAACNSPAIPPGNYGSVAGTITSSTGQPVAEVTVKADLGTSGVSGADGHYTIPTVPISSALSPTEIEVTGVPAGYGKPPPQNVQVLAGQTTSGVNFVLPKG